MGNVVAYPCESIHNIKLLLISHGGKACRAREHVVDWTLSCLLMYHAQPHQQIALLEQIQHANLTNPLNKKV